MAVSTSPGTGTVLFAGAPGASAHPILSPPDQGRIRRFDHELQWLVPNSQGYWDWSEGPSVSGAGQGAGQKLGGALDLEGKWLAYGADGSGSPAGVGFAQVLLNTSAGWQLEQHFPEPTGTPGTWFGRDVAVAETVHPWGTLAIGAPFAGTDGAVYLYRYIFDFVDWVWIPKATLSPLLPDGNTQFGIAVDLASDLLAVGAPLQDQLFGGSDVCGVYVYWADPVNWQFAQLLTAGDPAKGDRFGDAVAVTDSTLVVGAPLKWQDSTDLVGAVYVYERDSSAPPSFTEVAKLASPTSDYATFFGQAVAIDGDRIVVGAPGAVVNGERLGRAYVYERSGGVWPTTPSRVLDGDGQHFADFGTSVDLDGELVAVGAAKYGEGVPVKDGAVFVYDLASSFCAQPQSVSISSGGSQAFELEAGAAHAGLPYLVLGTTAGSHPGQLVDGVPLPLNWDGPGGYYGFTLTQASSATLPGTFGVLDAGGAASASVVLPPGLSPTLAGLYLHLSLIHI